MENLNAAQSCAPNCSEFADACAACAADPDSTVASLNSGCFCMTLREGAMHAALAHDPEARAILPLLEERCPYVFSAQPVFLSRQQDERMRAVIAAAESVIGLPAWRERVLAGASPTAQHDPRGPSGVLFGYDFHVEGDEVGLIEINTNAGGAMLNALLARAQHACCAAIERLRPGSDDADAFEQALAAMFAREWDKAERGRPLRTIAIVDEAPAQQYLYPEFLLFQRLFARHGWQALIAGPDELAWRDGRLYLGASEIDLVYNRLTDFDLSAPASAALAAAYAANAVVLTPHPRAHALYADKRNLALLTDEAALRELGAAPSAIAALLAGVPRTRIVRPALADELWAARRKLFFKPAAGFGSRAAYRGDKLTRRVWEDILQGDYIAQDLMAPGLRGAGEAALKFDIRVYAYEGRPLWTAARLYQGQTTNFRTPGGGFAPVYRIG